MIPEFDPSTGNLPPGEHRATWDELVARFGQTEWRAELLAGLRAAVASLKAAGCRRVYLDGSFVSAKEHPGDYDGCWDTEGVDFDLLDQIAPALLTFDAGRATQKAEVSCFSPIRKPARSARCSASFFRWTGTGTEKG